MNFNTPILNILSPLGFFQENQEIVIPQDSEARYELKKAGINQDTIRKNDRKQKLYEKYFQEKIIILNKQEKKNKLYTKLRNINIKNKIQLQPSKEKRRWTRQLETAISNNKVEFFVNDNDKNSYITGSWSKFLYLPKPREWNIKNNGLVFPTKIQERLMQELQSSPIFVVENIFNEVIAGEPKRIFYRNLINTLEEKYYNLFFWQSENELKEPYRIAFAFTNPGDAIELKEYLEEQFPYSAREINLSIKIMSLSEFYKLSRMAGPMNQIRIIPDIKDLGNLLLKFRKKGHIKFHKKQVYGKDFFQGQPIYRLMPAKTNIKNNNKENESIMIEYTPQYELGFLNDITFYFTDLQDAEKAWDNFYIRYNKVGIPKKPRIEVYNLESLISDYENNAEGTPNKIRIIPTREAKSIIEEVYNSEQNQKFSLKNYKMLSRAQIGLNRFIWGLTHRTPPTQYPAKWW